MQLKTLTPRKDKDDQPKPISITNNLIVKGEKTELAIPAEAWQYPQYESYSDFETAAGSPEKALEFINDAAREASVNAGKTKIRTTSVANTDEAKANLIKAGLEVAKTWTPAVTTERSSNKELVTGVINLRANLDSMSPEEVKAALQAMFSKVA